MSSKLFGQESLMKPVTLARCWSPLWLFHSWGQDTEHQVHVKSNSLCTVSFPSRDWKLSTECILESTGGARAIHLGTRVLEELCLQMPWLHLSTSFWSQVLISIHLALSLRFGVGALFHIKPIVFFFCLKIYQIAHGTPLSCILRMLSNASGKTAVTEGVFLTVYLCCVNVYVIHVCGRILAMACLYS